MTSAVADVRLTEAQRRVLEALPEYDLSCPPAAQYHTSIDEYGCLVITIAIPGEGWAQPIDIAQMTGLRVSSVQQSLNVLCKLQLAARSNGQRHSTGCGIMVWPEVYRRTPAGTSYLEATRRAR